MGVCGVGVRTRNVCVCGGRGENKNMCVSGGVRTRICGCVWGGGENKKCVCVCENKKCVCVWVASRPAVRYLKERLVKFQCSTRSMVQEFLGQVIAHKGPHKVYYP